MATFTTLEHLTSVANSITTKADARFRKLSDAIAKSDLATELSTEITSATTNIATLQGEDTSKSARTIAAEEVAKVVASAPASFDTLKEIADWIENDTTGAAAMANDIDALKDKTELGTHEVSGEQVEYSTVKDYVEAYVAEQIGDAELSAGNGIDITGNVVSAKIDSTNANGLAVTASGLKINPVTPSTSGEGGSAGAMTAADKEKLDNADVTAYTGTGAISVANHQISISAASPSTSGVGGAAGTMSAADKEKLDNADVTAYTAGNGVAVANHVLSAVVDTTNANGLSVGANGLAMAPAVASTSGAGGSNGAMSATDKEKLDGMTVATAQQISDLIDGLWA